MTALVVLMNNKAAAVAGDRAVTITDQTGSSRVRDGVRKVFELVPGKPISLMIYNNAELMGNAWEPIILGYARASAGKHFATVSECAEDFFRYIEQSGSLFPEALQRRHFENHLRLFYTVTRLEAEELLANGAAHGVSVASPAEALAIAAGRMHAQLTLDLSDEPVPFLPGFDEGYGRKLAEAYAEEINGLLSAYFAEFRPDRGTMEKLWQIAYLSVITNFFPMGLDFTGVVFTGYGEQQIYPELAAFQVEGIFLDRLRRRRTADRTISTDDPVVLQPFAQDRMLRTMLFGLDPALPEYLFGEMAALIEGTRENLVYSVPSLSEQAKGEIREFLSEEFVHDMWSIFFERLQHHVFEEYAHPIFASVATLPKRHLADAAENMVRITAFQQDVSGALPTVGGGVDAAVLTPEGFEWTRQADRGGRGS